LIKNEHQQRLILSYKGANLYQGCHPNVYGHRYAWDKVDAIVDLDNGLETASDDIWPAFPPFMPEGKIYLRWKIEDGDMPSKRILAVIGKTISNLIKSGQNVLVHCAAGQNRSVLVTASALYYLSNKEWDGEHIYRILKNLQPLALTNQSFRDFVQTIEQHLGKI